jgi:folate-binding protein YgfZ
LFFENELILLGTKEYNENMKYHLEKFIFTEDISVSKSKRFDTIAIIYSTSYNDNRPKSNSELFQLDIDNKLCSLPNQFIDNSFFFLFDSKNFNYGFFNKFRAINTDEYDKYRIISKIPEPGKEITNKVTPLECLLDKFVSFTKGCYIGQEVLTRLNSQNKLPKIFKRFSIETNYKFENKVFSLNNNSEEECGYITTKILDKNYYNCLGFIKNKFISEDLKFFVKANNQNIFINFY